MSYEGHTIGLCERGHQNVKDAYDVWTRCYHCGTSIVLSYEVDDTNCDGVDPALVMIDNTSWPYRFRPADLTRWWRQEKA